VRDYLYIRKKAFLYLYGDATGGLVQQPFAAMGAYVVKSSAVLLSTFVLG